MGSCVTRMVFSSHDQAFLCHNTQQTKRAVKKWIFTVSSNQTCSCFTALTLRFLRRITLIESVEITILTFFFLMFFSLNSYCAQRKKGRGNGSSSQEKKLKCELTPGCSWHDMVWVTLKPRKLRPPIFSTAQSPVNTYWSQPSKLFYTLKGITCWSTVRSNVCVFKAFLCSCKPQYSALCRTNSDRQ